MPWGENTWVKILLYGSNKNGNYYFKTRRCFQWVKKENWHAPIKNLDHLGKVAGIIDEIGIVKKINELIGEKETEKVSAGQVVKAMILNGMGLVSSPLYLFNEFFQGKAREHLIGTGVKAEYFNDDRLGRVWDKIYQIGLNQIFVSIVLEVIKKYELNLGATHLDSSSFSVHGEYENSGEPQTIKITYGYSRDRRPDLKQYKNEFNLHCRWRCVFIYKKHFGKWIRPCINLVRQWRISKNN